MLPLSRGVAAVLTLWPRVKSDILRGCRNSSWSCGIFLGFVRPGWRQQGQLDRDEREAIHLNRIAIELDHGSVAGTVASGFEPVARAFAENFRQHGDIGAACALYHRGDPVVDLWGGLADVDSQRPWQEDTIVLVFSAAKGPTVTCIHQLVEAGLLDLDLPIAHYLSLIHI